MNKRDLIKPLDDCGFNLKARDGVVFANSRDVAAFFGKTHAHVLRDIDALIKKDPEPGRRDFVESTYEAGETFGLSEAFNNLAGPKTYRCVDMTCDGFTLLAMGFNGSKALEFKRRIIAAFNAMQAELRNRTPVIDVRDPGQLAEVGRQLLAIGGSPAGRRSVEPTPLAQG